MSSRIEQIIDEIQEYIDNCKYQPLSNTKIVVAKDEIDELLRELRMKTPEEIRRYQKIISNKDAILSDAQTRADAIIAEATQHTSALVNEHEIMQQAYAQANEIVVQASNQAQEILDAAAYDANNIRAGAIQYTDEMLGNLQSIISHTLNSSAAKYDAFLTDLKRSYDIVNANRSELYPQEPAAKEESEQTVQKTEEI